MPEQSKRVVSVPQKGTTRLLEPVRPVPLGGFPHTPSSKTERQNQWAVSGYHRG